MNEGASTMSGFRWVLCLALALTFDLAQGALSLFGVGLLINRIINPAIGVFWYFLFRMSGINYVKGGKLQKGRIASIIIIFLIEESGLGDFLPGWTAQVLMTYLNSKADALASSIDSVSRVLSVAATIKKGFPLKNTRPPKQEA